MAAMGSRHTKRRMSEGKAAVVADPSATASVNPAVTIEQVRSRFGWDQHVRLANAPMSGNPTKAVDTANPVVMTPVLADVYLPDGAS